MAVLDDHRARQAARAHGVQVTGTLGILVRAKRATLIPRMAPLVEAMKGLGFYASDEVIREVLKSVGEKWAGEQGASDAEGRRPPGARAARRGLLWTLIADRKK